MIEPFLYPPLPSSKPKPVWKRQSGDVTLSSELPSDQRCCVSPYTREHKARTPLAALLNRLRSALRLLSLGPATFYDDSADGFQQPVPRHRRYNCSVHREPESFSSSGRPFYKGDVDSVEQLTLRQFYPYCCR